MPERCFRVNLVGKKIKVTMKKGNRQTTGNGPYPEWGGITIPVLVKHEYPTYYLCEVLPHNTGNQFFNKNSNSYTVTIDKFAIESGLFKIEEVK